MGYSFLSETRLKPLFFGSFLFYFLIEFNIPYRYIFLHFDHIPQIRFWEAIKEEGMNRYTCIFIVVILNFLFISLAFPSNDKYWAAIDSVLRQGLPKTAVQYLDTILTNTQKEKKYDEWLKALSLKITYEATIEGNKPEEKIKRLKVEFSHADKNTKPLLQTILAQWYWHYYNRNQWRFMNRTASDKLLEEDFTTWDLPKLFREIDSLYQNILKAKDQLSKIETEQFLGFLEKGSMPNTLRPTLYDFIAQEALTFYSRAEQAAAQPEDAFEIEVATNAFAPLDQFISYHPATTDTNSSKLKALIIFQALAAFHTEQKNDTALLDLEIQRFNYLKNTALGEDKNRIFIQRMTDLLGTYSSYEESSLGLYYLAKAWAEEGNLAKAYTIAKKGVDNYSLSIGKEYCRNYVLELTQKSLTLTGEQCVPSEQTKLQISYKNFTKIYFKIIADTWDGFINKRNGRPHEIDEKKAMDLLSKKPAAEWETDLPSTDDLKEKRIKVDVPKLEPGYYRIFASWQSDFKKSTMVQNSWLWVSRYTVVSRTGPAMIDGFVLDAVTGNPVEGAKVTQIIWKNYTVNEPNHYDYYYQYERGDQTRTDAEGYFKFHTVDKGFLIQIEKNGEQLLTTDYMHPSSGNYEQGDERTLFFTDRSLYRPGQIIYFKGICRRIDQSRGIYEIIPNRDVTVYFRDANSQEISRQTVRTNDFGSFSGQFTAPTDRLTGSMSIHSDYPSGYTSINVEEYKRPKFSVELEKPKQAFKLNQEIVITGKAVAYTGAPIDNALVQFSVSRNTSFPYWWSWYYYSSYSRRSDQQIAHGKIKTDSAGTFKIIFFAKPDLKISPENDPTFTFSIHADVVSPDGETRSGDASVRIGYSAMAVNISSDEDLTHEKDFPLVIATQTLDGNFLSAKAHIQIFQLKEPNKPVREKLGYSYGEKEGIEDSDGEFTENWMKWPKVRKVYENTIQTDSTRSDTVMVKLPCGLYQVECTSQDKYNKEVKAFLPLMILPDWNSKFFSIKLPSVVRTRSTTVEVGGTLRAFWGTGYPSGRCFIEIERDDLILDRYWTNEKYTQHTFEVPVTENLRGGFSVHFTYVRENRAYLKTIAVNVPWTNKELDVALETFRDKLAPGEKETMTIKIKGKKSPISEVEMVAAMYDFSLDQFYPHFWPQFDFFKRSYSHRQTQFINRPQPFTNLQYPGWNDTYSYPGISYIHFPYYVIENFFYFQFPSRSISAATTHTSTLSLTFGVPLYSKKKEFAGDKGKFTGIVVDAQTGEPLIGANINVVGTSLGAATDIDGNYLIAGVPVTTYSIKVSLVGYESFIVSDVKSEKGKTTTINIKLKPTTIEGQEVLVTAQIMSQTETHNQVASSQMINVVSEEKIQELPDANAAEAIGKLAGISLMGGKADSKTIDLKNVTIRKNLNETAFFYPHLLMGPDSTVKIEFTMPEALTKWKFMGFAHGKKCESGMVTGYTVTRKDLMVQPNAPRFLREGDSIYFTAKVINISDKQQQGLVQLDFKDFMTEQPINTVLGLSKNVQTFDLKPNSSETFSWRITIPKGTGAVSYTVAAKSNNISDGETGSVPVLSNRIFLTESLPLHIRGPQSKTFVFDRLKRIGKSKTFDPYRFTVQMASNPTWYAIQALPYLIEFPFECSEQIFNRYYANSLAAHITHSNPRIKEVFQSWRGTNALKSNLEKNQELKSVLLMETPWVREAQNETQAKQNIASLFEENTLNENLNSALAKLKNNQLGNGGWSWFPGGYPSDYITLYITTGFGRLKHLGVKIDNLLALKAVDYLDRWLKDTFDHIRDTSLNHTSSTIALYLYSRSFFLQDRPIPPFAKEAVDYFIRQSEKHWLTLDSRLSQGYVALALHRFGNTIVPKKIVASLKERSVQNEEMGMFWRDDELSWWWYRAPIETQALMIEAFAEVANDAVAMEDCKVWLLKQKQTQNWKSTKATADAVYALVLRGADYLVDTKLVEVKLGNEIVKPEKVEPGTGFYEKVYTKKEIVPQFSAINVKKENKGIAWGSVHLQYFEDMGEVTSHATNLKLEKKLFVKNDTKKGKVLEPIARSVHVGDCITVRIVLKVDRAMEYVHLKDMRGSGLEPVDVLSGYRYQDGLRYYQSTKDAATHFFIDYLPKGTYVFEYDLRVQLRGSYQNGVAEIQCMYAPEFNSHSESQQLIVK